MEDGIESTMHSLYNSDRNTNKDKIVDINKKLEGLDPIGHYLYVCIPKEKKNSVTINECIITDNKNKVLDLLKHDNLEINIYKKV